MKKRMISLLLLCALLCCSCKKEAAPAPTQPPPVTTVVGSWSAHIDITEHMNQMLNSQMGIDHLSSSFSVVLCLVVSEDGTYSLTYDQSHLSDQLDIMGNVLWQFVVDQAAAQSGLTTDEASKALQEQGKNQKVLEEELKLVSFFDNTFVKNGFWKLENDELYFSDVADVFAEENAVDIILSADQLTLSYQIGIDEDEKPIARTVVFNRG